MSVGDVTRIACKDCHSVGDRSEEGRGRCITKGSGVIHPVEQGTIRLLLDSSVEDLVVIKIPHLMRPYSAKNLIHPCRQIHALLHELICVYRMV